jgi:AcrR family transcriptional regulator
LKTNAQRSDDSRRTLIAAARDLFGRQGYSATSTPAIARAAGVSRGALYHHFADKAALFYAVVQAEYKRVEGEIEKDADTTGDTLEILIEGGERFMTAMNDPASRKILLVDGPAVLGAEQLLGFDRETISGSLRAGIIAAQTQGRLPASIPPDALASMMSGAYDRAVLDGLSQTDEGRLAIMHAIRSVWFGLSKVA